MKHHIELTTENYKQLLDCVPWKTFSDPVFKKLIDELENKTSKNETSFISNELHVDLFFLMVYAYELGRCRGKQTERSKRKHRISSLSN